MTGANWELPGSQEEENCWPQELWYQQEERVRSKCCVPQRPRDMRKISFYGQLHTEKGSKSWPASNSKMDTCSLSCEVNRSPNTYNRSHPLAQSSERNRCLHVALPQQLALLCPCSGSFYPLQHYARSR